MNATTTARHMTVFGTAHSGRQPAVILLPAVGCPRESLTPLATELTREATVIALDLPGSGSLRHVPFSLHRCERLLEAVLLHPTLQPTGTDSRPALVLAGYASGAHVALRCLPGAGATVDGVILCGPVRDTARDGALAVWAAHAAAFPGVSGAATRLLETRVLASRDFARAERQALLRAGFHLSAVAAFASEASGSDLGGAAREFDGDVLVVTPREESSFVARLREHLRAPPLAAADSDDEAGAAGARRSRLSIAELRGLTAPVPLAKTATLAAHIRTFVARIDVRLRGPSSEHRQSTAVARSGRTGELDAVGTALREADDGYFSRASPQPGNE